METSKSTQLEKPENVGKLISSDQKDFLLRSFQETYPDRNSSFSISRQLLSYILTEPGVSGIRFMYGMKNLAQPETCIVLMPCNYDFRGNGLPNIIVQQDGYFLHTGEQFGLEETWKILFNHVMNEHRLSPKMNVKEIHRGDYWGINKLMDFVNNSEAKELRFNLGYSPIEDGFTKGIHPVLEAIDDRGNSLDIYMDFSSPCPRTCSGEEECIATNVARIIMKGNAEEELNVLRSFREGFWVSSNGYLVEMYYHTSPVIASAINKLENREEIYRDIYSKYLKPCLKAIDNNDRDKTAELLNKSFADLVLNYVS